jgi:chaperonin GroES
MAEEIINLANELSDKKRKEIAESVLDGYQTDLSSRSEWESRHANWSKLYSLQRDPKNFPWEDCSNVALPMLTMACMQYQARAYEALLPSKNISKSFPVGEETEDKAKAERTEKYRNFLIDFRIKEFRKSMDVTLLKMSIEGCVIRKTYYDSVKGRLVSDYLSPTDFVVNYATRYLEDSERYTQNLYKSVNTIKILQKKGIYLPVDLSEPGNTAVDEVKLQHLKNVGLTPSSSSDNISPRLILEQHTYIDLGNSGGIKEPMIATVDYESGELLRLVSRRHPKAPNEVMEYFTKYDFIPNPDGFYGYGFGLLLEGPNESVNSIINQLIDSGTLQNLQGGFTLSGSGAKKGDIEFQMGMFKELKLKGDDIRKAILPFNFGSPSQVLFSLLGGLQDYANRLTTVTETQTGALPSSDTSATAVAAAIEQGTKVFSSIHKRTHQSLAEELYKVDRLLSLYLDLDEYYRVVINDNTVKQFGGNKADTLAVISKDFDTPLDVRPVSDSNIISRQEKAAKAQFVYNTILSNPLTANDPESIYLATVNLMKVLDIDDAFIQQLVKLPQAQEPVDLTQEQEIQKMISGEDVIAKETDNHQQHIAVIQEFEQSDFYGAISGQAKGLIEKHKQAHISFLYLQKVQEQRTQEQVLIQEAVEGGEI